MISLKEYNELHASYGKRDNDKEMFILTLVNSHSVVKSAEILSNKGGFSGNNTILGYSENETDGWGNDFPNDGLFNGRLIGIVFNPILGKFVVFKNNSTKTHIKIYSIETDGTFSLLNTLDVSANVLSGSIEVIYQNINQVYIIIGSNASSKLAIYIINAGTNNFFAYQEITTSVTVRGGIGVNKIDGNIFFTNGFGTHSFKIHNPFTNTNIQTIAIPSVAGGYALKSVVHDEVNNKYFMITQGTPKSEIFSVDVGNSYALNQFFEYNYNSGGEIALIDNKLYVIVNNNNGQMLLQKFDIQTETLISSRIIKESSVSGFHILTDDKKNFYLLTNNNLEGYDVDGNKIFDYSTNSRNSSNGVGNLFIGGNEITIIGNQFFNPNNNTFALQGSPTINGGTVWLTNPNYVGGLNDFEVQTSANSYTSANTDYNINPISVTSMTLFYKNGGTSLNNSLKYSYSSSTGKEVRKLINPKSYLDVTGDSDKIVEIKFEQPIIIDSKHFFKVDLNPSEELTFAFFYEQANISDILTNKFFLR